MIIVYCKHNLFGLHGGSIQLCNTKFDHLELATVTVDVLRTGRTCWFNFEGEVSLVHVICTHTWLYIGLILGLLN